MTTALRQGSGISRIRDLVTSVGVALQIWLVATLVANPLAQAQTLTVLHSFTGGADGASPHAGLIRDAAGNLYGTTSGLYDLGTVFKVDATGKQTVLHSFTGPEGATPYTADLIRDAAGNVYGTTLWGGDLTCDAPQGCGTVFKLTLNTGTYEVLHNFKGGADGANPFAGLIRDPAGNFYGTTARGGASDFGTVFKLDASGKESVLHSFNGADGAFPESALVRDAGGNLYGTTYAGGASNFGTVFKLDATGKETVLHSFNGADGAYPYAGLIRDAGGNLYGTTPFGGGSTNCVSECGTVFKLDATGKETVLHIFTGADGGNPYGRLIRDAGGNLYGTTLYGGDLSCISPDGCGTVFKLTINNTTGKYKVLHNFKGGGDGAAPYAGVIQDAGGNLYGTTFWGGDLTCNAPFGCGTVFRLTP